MGTLFNDIRYGLRSLSKRPGFSLIAIVTLALGIGANSAIFSVVNAVLLRPLSFPESERVVVLEGVNPKDGITRSNMSVPDIVDWQNQTQSFEQLVAFSAGGFLLTSNDETERLRGAAVSSDFFPLIKTSAVLGRTLQADDAVAGREPVIVLGHGLWQRRFGGDEKIVGAKVMISGKPATIVGVMPPGFDYPAQVEIWAPFILDAAAERRDNRYLNVIGRLKPGATVEQAQAELTTINQRLAQSYVETNTGWDVRVSNWRERLVASMRTSLLVLLGAVAFVLLIACANVANLLLARVTSRHKEMAVRAALGASRFRIIRQLLTESVLLSVIGGALGLALSVWLTRLLLAIVPAGTPRVDEVHVDGRVLLFTVGISLLTGIVFGIAPALQTSNAGLNEHLKESGRRSGSERNRLGSALIVSEVALSFMLLVGAGLLIKSFIRLRDVSPGFNPANVLTVRMGLVPGKYKQGEPRAQIFQQAIDRVQTVPGVESAAGVLSMPLGGDTLSVGRSYIREGQPATPEESANADYLVITPDYFKTLQIPVVSGRPFTIQDNGNNPKVVIVNQTMARRLWPGENPVGRRITIWRDEQFPREIVGVVGDTKQSLDSDASPQMYVPYAQDATWGSLTFLVRATSGDPAALAPAIRSEIRLIDRTLPLYNIKTMDEVLGESMALQRTSTLLLGTFAGLALLLSMIGIYGITSYYVTQRTHEIGIRMALGAQLRDVISLVLTRGAKLAMIGIGVGLVGAFALTRLMATLLFGVKPIDLLTFAGVSVCLMVVATIACYIPARRASKVDPLVALRYE